MQQEIELAIAPDFIDNGSYITELGAKKLKIPRPRIKGYHIQKRSIDARSRQVVYRIKVLFFIDEDPIPQLFTSVLKNVRDAPPVIIIGAGPAGLFAAYRCVELGLKPIVVERGKDVRDRRRDLAKINKEGVVNPKSNYCFGEGGAGTYSDGKLYTRSNKRGDVNKVLSIFVEHGADRDILVDARPHIGTNKLPHVIESIRNRILELGGEILFDTKVIDIHTAFGQVTGVQTATGSTLEAKHIILATGHSAR